MEVLTEEQMREKMSGTSMRPLKHEPRSPVRDMWPIPFEYHGGAKGTHISCSSAKVIAGELLLAVARVEQEELRAALDDERKRAASIQEQLHKRVNEAEEQLQVAFQESARLRRKLKKGKR